MSDLDQLLDYMRFTHEYRDVQRVVYYPKKHVRENDLEHTGQLGLVCWYLIDKHNLPLDRIRVYQYALAHDLVEVYAGDVFAHDTNERSHRNKAHKEAAALKRIRDRFPLFTELHHTIEKYEQRNDDEGRFVSAVDKVLPFLNTFLDGGRIWRENQVSLETILKNKREKIGNVEPVRAYLEEIASKLQQSHDQYFNDTKQ